MARRLSWLVPGRRRTLLAVPAVVALVALPGLAAAAPAALTGQCATAPAPASTTPNGFLALPSPERPDLLSGVNLGVKPDRLLCSSVPGTVTNTERVLVGLTGAGAPATVQVDQQLSLRGTGNYVIRERGPARIVVGLGDSLAPVLQRGTVVWQGFVPGRRDLAALLTLDPGLEAARLPLTVSLSFTAATGGAAVALGPGGVVPGAGTVAVRIANQTTLPNQQLPTGEGQADALAQALTVMARAAAHPGVRPPTAGHGGLPTTVAIDGPGGARFGDVIVPLRVTGSIRLTGTSGPVSGSGPGTRTLVDGVAVAGTLNGEATINVHAPAAGTLVLDLTAVPALDPRQVRPPPPATSWAQWAAANPGPDARAAATDTLVDAAAATAAATSYSPYLAAGLAGPVSTAFHFAVAPAPPAPVVVHPLHAHPGPIAVTLLAALLVGIGMDQVRRRV